MAFLFVDSVAQNNSRFVQISGKILEVMLLIMGLISTLVVMKEAVLPYSCDLVFSSLVGFWSSIRCFLSSSPTIIIIIINVVVLLILASSAFCGRDQDNRHSEISLLDVDDHHLQTAEQQSGDHDYDHDHQTADHDYKSLVISPPPPRPSWDIVEVTPPPPTTTSPRTTIPIRNNTSSTKLVRQGGISPHLVQKETLPLLLNQALIPTPHELNQTTKSPQSTKALPPPPSLEKWKDVYIENDEEEDTMEATWKAITGGGNKKPKKNPLKKSGTWNAPQPPPSTPPPRRSVAMQRLDSEEVMPTSPKWKELRKAETFDDAVSLMRRGGLIRRDPSMSLEEFNQKVEAFIKKSNDKMRLERQESHQRFWDMFNRKHH